MGWLPVPNPVAFSILGIEVRWYAICIVVGMMLAVNICGKRAKKHGLSEDFLWELFLVAAPSGVVGARLYYVIFEWDMYKDDLMQVFNMRAGGLAIHGGLIGVFLAIFLYTRYKKQNFIAWADLVASGFPLGQAIGRWGNYFNSEAHGGPTDLPWAIYADGEWVHPTFLYESIWCFLLFFFLLWFMDKRGKDFDGQIVCFYAILYSVERIFVEGLRTDSLYIGPLRQAQVLSACVIFAGLVLYIVLKKKSEKTLAANAERVEAEKNE